MEMAHHPLSKHDLDSLSAMVINFIIQEFNLPASSSSKKITTKQVGIPCHQSCIDGNTLTAGKEITKETEIQGK